MSWASGLSKSSKTMIDFPRENAANGKTVRSSMTTKTPKSEPVNPNNRGCRNRHVRQDCNLSGSSSTSEQPSWRLRRVHISYPC
mmetsp:Transcript_41063/g.89717  ORF Transcript_41063/g.89717 Transcript_41063/m.89717 type:complete len:84 (+) Transcript_41063:968-1219(+)